VRREGEEEGGGGRQEEMEEEEEECEDERVRDQNSSTEPLNIHCRVRNQYIRQELLPHSTLQR